MTVIPDLIRLIYKQFVDICRALNHTQGVAV